MAYPRQADLESLLDALNAAGVEMIVIGGAACVLHGAPVTTLDLDIIHHRTTENAARLMTLLSDLDARIRDPADRGLRPTAELLLGPGQLNLETRLGPLDPLGRLHDGRGYEELLSCSVELHDGDLQLRVLDLPTLIEVKSTSGRAKDRLVVPVLLALERDRRPR